MPVEDEAFFQRYPLHNAAWRALLQQPHLAPARQQILREIDAAGSLPPANQVFAALEATPLPAVRVVIIGQDPYPSPGDAHGLSFSVAHGRPPRSLVNIFTEVQRDCGGPRRSDANLSDWAAQGVLLLNRVLTTPPGQAGGHRGRGWEALTQALLQGVLARPQPLALLLWGAQAAALAKHVESSPQRCVLISGHPSPLAYNRPSANSFKACGHFAAVNSFLQKQGMGGIRWG